MGMTNQYNDKYCVSPRLSVGLVTHNLSDGVINIWFFNIANWKMLISFNRQNIIFRFIIYFCGPAVAMLKDQRRVQLARPFLGDFAAMEIKPGMIRDMMWICLKI